MTTTKGSTKISKKTNNVVGLSARDICKIIKECRASGVLSLNVNGMELTFGSTEEALKAPRPAPIPAPDPQEIPEAAKIDEKTEMEAAQLLVTEPEAYEALMQLEDVK